MSWSRTPPRDIYRQMLAHYFNERADKAVRRIDEFEKDVKRRFIVEPGQMRLLIVVDKLLTGFDAPSATYLYIDKTMRDHGLFQAICRVNRLDGDDKTYGYVIDYRDLFKSLDKAITDYTSEALDGYAAQDIEGLLEEAYRANALFDAHRDDPEFGYRYLLDEARDAGQAMAARTAWQICSDNGWWSAFGKKRAKNGKKSGPPVHDDLCAVTDEKGRVRHEFKAQTANELWIGDITEHWTDEGKLYVCAFKDVYSNRIVGYSIDSRMKSRLAVAALNNAVARRGDVAVCVVQTDRGSQFRSRRFVRALGRHDMVGSMGRVGAAGDNAAMESFFSLLQKNVLDRHTWQPDKTSGSPS